MLTLSTAVAIKNYHDCVIFRGCFKIELNGTFFSCRKQKQNVFQKMNDKPTLGDKLKPEIGSCCHLCLPYICSTNSPTGHETVEQIRKVNKDGTASDCWL